MNLKLIKLNLIMIFLFFSNSAFTKQWSDCPCCHLIRTTSASCELLAPAKAPHVYIKFDFKKADSTNQLYVIEECGKSFEVNRDDPPLNGNIAVGEIILVLCKKDELLSQKKLPITTNYTALCNISQHIECNN